MFKVTGRCRDCRKVGWYNLKDVWVKREGDILGICERHKRKLLVSAQLRGMISRARTRGKAVPSMKQLLRMVPRDMKCPDCKETMVWKMAENPQRVMTLQHYRSGKMALVCLSCNSRHHYMPGDTYRKMPKDHKRCPQCEAIKPFADFYRDKSRSGIIKNSSSCIACTLRDHRNRHAAMKLPSNGVASSTK